MQIADMAGKFESVETCLEKNVPEDELKEVKRILFGKACRLELVIMYHYFTDVPNLQMYQMDVVYGSTIPRITINFHNLRMII